MSRIRAAFLDAGNTLIALDYPLIATLLGRGGHAVAIERLRLAEARARVRLDPHLRERQATEHADVFRLYVRHVLAELGIAWGAAGERLVADLRAANPPFGIWSVGVPGAADVLVALRRAGLRLAVVSNSNGTVADNLRAAGLAGHLDLIVDSGVVGLEKPDPRIFRHAADALGVRPEEAIHVGDLYAIDVLGARAAGCRAILLDPAGAWPPLDCDTAVDLAAAGRRIEALARA